MTVLTKRQIVARYGEDKYYEFQGWLHRSGAPTKAMVDEFNSLRYNEDYEVPATVERWGSLVFKVGGCGYFYLVDESYPNDMIPAYGLYHNFGNSSNYVADVR